MKMYLVQHAKAKSEEEDPDRPLSQAGQEDIRDTAAAAASLGLGVEKILHSGKLRAEQTAETLQEQLSPPQGVDVHSGLGPVDDVQPVAEELDTSAQSMMLVGHLPFMERLTGLLVAGDEDLPVVAFQNGAVVCLEKADVRWQISWILTPEMSRL